MNKEEKAGVAGLNPWPARRRDSATSLALARRGLGTRGWFASSRCTQVRVHAQRHMLENGRRARVWVHDGAADRRRATRRRGWGGHGPTMVCAYENENGRAGSRTTQCSRHLDGLVPRRAAPWLAAAEAGELDFR
jgi:hypothetical protein